MKQLAYTMEAVDTALDLSIVDFEKTGTLYRDLRSSMHGELARSSQVAYRAVRLELGGLTLAVDDSTVVAPAPAPSAVPTLKPLNFKAIETACTTIIAVPMHSQADSALYGGILLPLRRVFRRAREAVDFHLADKSPSSDGHE